MAVLELLARATEAWVVAGGNEQLVNRSSRTVDGVSRRCTAFAGLTATLTAIVFTQLGFMPTRSRRSKKVPLSKEYWEMNNFRTVQYVQTSAQREASKEHSALLVSRQSDISSC